MSADNGVYILITPYPEDPTKDEYRVAHCQAIENVTRINAEWSEVQPAYAVLFFGNSNIYDNKSDALLEAMAIEDEILEDEFCPILEYGICEVRPGFDGPFPKMTMDEARKVIDTYDDPGDISYDDQLS